MTDTPPEVTIPIADLIPTEDNPGQRAVDLLGQVLCETRHMDVFRGPDDIPATCDEDQAIALRVVQSDWLPMFMAYREQKAAAQAIDQVVADTIAAKAPAESRDAYARMADRLTRAAQGIRPLIDTDNPPPPRPTVDTPREPTRAPGQA